MGQFLRCTRRSGKRVTIVCAIVLSGCADLLYGGETIRVSGTVTVDTQAALGWEVRLMPAGTPNTTFDSAVTDASGRYRELVVFGQTSCGAIRVATRPPGDSDGAWTEREVGCGVNRVDFSF